MRRNFELERLRGLSRREALRLIGAVGGVIAVPGLFAACGGGAPAAPPSAGSSAAPAAPAASPAAAPVASAPAAAPAAASPAAVASGKTPKRGGTLRFGLSTDPSNLEPHVSTGAASASVKSMVYSGLLTYDRGGKIVPDLAESYDSPDPQTYIFKLRRGVTFHDGSPFTADDVKFTFERIRDPKTAATLASRLTDLDTIETPDQYTVVLKLKQPNYTLPAHLALSTASIVSRKWIESGVDPKQRMLGTGPFKFIERVPNVAIKLERNPNYFLEGKPYFDAMEFIPMPDDNARVTALRTGAVEIIDYVPFTHMALIEADPKLRLHSDRTQGFGWIGFVCDQPPFDSVKVRQAVAWALNREAIAETAFSGRGAPITGGVIPPGWIGYANLEGTYTYNPEKAKQLLAEAGFPNGFKTKMLTTSTYSVISKPAEAAQSQLQAVGIDAELVMQEWLIFRKSVEERAFPMHAWGTAPEINDPDWLSQYLASNSVFAPQLRFSDSQIDTWLEQARRIKDPEERTRLYVQVEKRVLELCPWVYTVRREQAEATAAFLEGYEHIPASGWPPLTLRESWFDK